MSDLFNSKVQKMAQRGNITLTDATPVTPVNHVFYPFKQQNDTIFWQDRTQTILAGMAILSCAQRPADKNRGATTLSWKLENPVLADVSGTNASGFTPDAKVSHTNIGKLEFVLAAKSTAQERKDLLYQMKDLINEAIISTQVESGDMIF